MNKQQIDQRRRVSCKRCQDRKIKCSRTSPCQRCTAAGVRCEFRGDGMKRAPISREYVSALEDRVGVLESLLQELNPARNPDQEVTMNTTNFGLESPTSVRQETSFDDSPSSDESHWGGGFSSAQDSMHSFGQPFYRENRLNFSPPERANYLGPSSFRTSKVLKSAGEHSSTHYSLSHKPASVNGQAEVDGHVVAECVALFFRWHYPQCMFIDRDKFLLGFLNHSYTSNHSSRSLEFCLCALGALLSSKKAIRDLARGFYESAIRSLESGGFLEPQETSIQALTLCSFYQIGQGNFSQAWMLSGIAFRMCEELNDSSQEGCNGTPSTPRDVDSRRLSLVLGRLPAVAKQALPAGCKEIERTHSIWHIWLEQNGLSDLGEPEALTDPTSPAEKQMELCKIIHDMLLPRDFSWGGPGQQPATQRWTEVAINELNTRLWGWHSTLPGELRWNRWGSCSDTVIPSIAALHMLYNTSQILLNLPLLDSQPLWKSSYMATQSKLVTNAVDICEASVDTILSILRRFRSQYTLTKAPFGLVQGGITAADAIFVMMHFCDGEKRGSLIQDLYVLDGALLEMSYSWNIAAIARTGLRNLLAEMTSSESTCADHFLSLNETQFALDVSVYQRFTPLSQESDDGIQLPGLDFPGMFSAGVSDTSNSDIWDLNYPDKDYSFDVVPTLI